MTQFLQVFRAECAIDDTMIATHRDRHSVAHDELVAIIDNGNFGDLADGKNEALGGLITAEKLSMPIPPRFETVNVPP